MWKPYEYSLYALSIIYLLCYAATLEAKRPYIPLMPPRDFASSENSNSQYTLLKKPTHSTVLGLELGTLGRKESSHTDAAGMQLYWGGRVMARIPILFINDLYIKPSIGFFRRVDNSVLLSSTQTVFEGGLGLQYALISMENFNCFLGIANRLDYASYSIALYSGPQTSSDAWRFRMGPSIGTSVGLTRNLAWNVDFEYSFSFAQSSRQYGGLTTGISFRLD